MIKHLGRSRGDCGTFCSTLRQVEQQVEAGKHAELDVSLKVYSIYANLFLVLLEKKKTLKLIISLVPTANIFLTSNVLARKSVLSL